MSPASSYLSLGLTHCHPVAPTSQCGPRPRVFSFLNLIVSCLIGLFGQGMRLYYLYRRNADMQPCHDWDSKPRFHCRNGRRPYRTPRRTVSQFKIRDFSGEAFKGFEVL
jgi:hypothetical protein